MKYSRKAKMKTTFVISILLGFGVLVLLQLASAAVVAVLLGQGSIAEEHTTLAAAVIRAVGVIAGGIITWLLATEKRVVAISVVVAGGVVLPFITALLFWEVDAPSVAGTLAVSAAALWVTLARR